MCFGGSDIVCGGGAFLPGKAREGERMLTRPLLNQILFDEAMVRGLLDPEARVLIEWLVERAEEATWEHDEATSEKIVRRLCRRARSISRFIYLWCYQRARGAALQLAASERFPWPMPTGSTDPCIMMQDILSWEDELPHDRVA
jgi:hypothetical protein